MSKIIGIDLGTTNSAVAIMEGDKVRVIEIPKALVRRLPSSPTWKTAKFWSVPPQSARP